MTMVDWGTVISRRSENEKRISGDIKPHYGLEARPLFAQQLMHSLILADEQIPSSIHKIEEMAGD
jgi:hypothetical protein